MGFLTDLYLSRKPLKAFVLMGVMWASFAAIMPDLKAQIGASDAEIGVAFMIGNISALLTAWLAPRVDVWLGRYAMAVSGCGMAASLALMGGATSLLGFTLAMFLAALCSGVADILMNARVAEVETEAQRPLMNLNHAMFSFAFAGGAAVVGVLRQAGWSPFEVGMLVLAISIVLAPGSIIAASHSHADDTGQGAGLGHRVVIWLVGLVVLTSFITEHTVETWSALHIERTLDGTAAQGAFGPALIGLTMGLGRLFGHVLVRRVRDLVLLGVACLVAALGIAMVGVAQDLTLAYLGLSILGLGISLVFPLSISLVGRIVPASERVRAIGQATVIGYGAFFLGPLVVGLSAEMLGLRAAFMLVGLVMVGVALGIVPMIARRTRRVVV